jgi:hypothetical protein
MLLKLYAYRDYTVKRTLSIHAGRRDIAGEKIRSMEYCHA